MEHSQLKSARGVWHTKIKRQAFILYLPSYQGFSSPFLFEGLHPCICKGAICPDNSEAMAHSHTFFVLQEGEIRSSVQARMKNNVSMLRS